MGRGTRRLVGSAIALVMVLSLGAAAAGRDAEPPPSVVYAYDAAGRLVAVTVPQLATAVYHYDRVGNLVQAERRPWDALSVFSVVPARASPGDQVVIHGAGFSPYAGRQRVLLGGAPAEVVEATGYALTVTVPPAAASGPVRVSTGGAEAVGEVAFQAVRDRAPVVAELAPPVVAPGDQLTVRGQRFTGDPMVDAVVLSGSTYATVESATPGELVVTVPPAAASGQVSVATPDGTGTADATLLVMPWEDVPAGDVTNGGQVTLGEAAGLELRDGAATALTFNGARDQRVALTATGELACRQLTIGLAGPTGSVREPSRGSGWCADGDREDGEDSGAEPVRLPADGVYTLLVAPRGQRAGPVELRLTDATTAGPTATATPPTAGSPAPTAGSPAPTTGSPAPSTSPPVPAPTAAPGSGPPGGDLPAVDLPEVLSAGNEPLLDGAGVAPVDLGSGRLVVAHTDLVVDDLLPVALTRTYQPVSGRVSSRDVYEFGLGSGLEYAMTVRFSSALQFADLVMPNGQEVPFERVTEGAEAEGAVFEPPPTGGPFDHSRITFDGGAWRLALAGGAELRFSNHRRAALTAVQDANGNVITIDQGRDRLGRPGPVRAVYTPSGRWIAFDYDDQGRVTRAYDHIGRTVSYRYDDEELLARVESSTGEALAYEYDGRRRVRRITSGEGDLLLAVAYDEDDRVVRQQLADGSELSVGYQLTEQVTEVAHPDGEVRETELETIAAAELTDTAGLVRRVEFDSGRWVSDTYGAGTEDAQTFAVERDPDTGFVTATEDSDGLRTEVDYDEAGRPVRLAETGGGAGTATYELAYDSPRHDLTSLVGPDGAQQRFAYDEAGNLVGHTGPDGAVTGYGYDAQGRLTELTDADGSTTRIDYELAHRVSVTDPDGHTYREFFDAAGRLVAITDAAGATTRIEYDRAGAPVTVTDPAGGQTELRYDADGNLAAVTDAAGNTTSYERNEDGLVRERTDATGASDRYTYDAFGRPVAHVDRAGVRTTRRYDSLGRLAAIGYGVDDNGDPESTVAFRYDAADRLVEVDDSTYGVIELEYDQRGRLVAESTPDGQIAYDYDDADRRVAMTLPDGRVTEYGYDRNGQLSHIDNGDAALTATRDRRGMLQRLELPGVTADYRVDERGMLRGIDYRDEQGGPVGDLHYRYDPAGRRTTAGGSLLAAEAPAAAGPYEYDAGNRLLRSDSATYTYDQAGRLVDDGVNTYTWDARGQLVAVEGDVSASFDYDPFGRRVEGTVDGATTRYTYDGDNVVQERRDGAVAATYLAGLAPDELFARVDATGVRSYLTDPQGSVLALANPDGEITTGYGYDPYGAVTAHGEPDPNAFGFTGREHDATGLIYHRHRYYHPQLGRFLSEDPLGFEAGDPNLYAYTFGDPVNHTDPDGRQAVGAGLGVCLSALGVTLGVALDAWDEMMEILDPDRGPQFGTEEASIALDRINRRLQMTIDAWINICSVALGLSFPGFGGLATRGVSTFGRGLPTVGRGLPTVGRGLPTVGRAPGITGRLPGLRPGLPRPAAPRVPARPVPRAGCSFDGDTEVLLADGTTTPISQVRVGDEVLAADPATGERGPREVTHTWAHEDTLVDLEVADGAVATTTDHPFWSEDAGAWLTAGDLAAGGLLLTADGAQVAVDGLDSDTARVDTAYHLTVDGLRTYHVLAGDAPVLVHNTCPWQLDRLSQSGTREIAPGLSRAGQKLQQHGGQGQFPVPTGSAADISRAGQFQLDDILTDPGAVTRPIRGGNFAGGRYYIAPDGRGAAFDADGVFQYFGVFTP